jgi:hypothetical protein
VTSEDRQLKMVLPQTRNPSNSTGFLHRSVFITGAQREHCQRKTEQCCRVEKLQVKKTEEAWLWWLTPVIPATLEEEINQAILVQEKCRTLSALSKTKAFSWRHGSSG